MRTPNRSLDRQSAFYAVLLALCLSIALTPLETAGAGTENPNGTGSQSAGEFTIEVPPEKSKSDPEKEAMKTFEHRTDRGSVPSLSLRTVTARISGSLCPVCLRTLTRKLEVTKGVVEVKIERPVKLQKDVRLPEPVAEHSPRFAPCEISYDCRQISLEEIKRIIKTHDLFAWQITDKCRPKKPAPPLTR